MPWLALPFQEQAVQKQLSSRFSVMGIPRLVIVGSDGGVSRGGVGRCGAGWGAGWCRCGMAAVVPRWSCVLRSPVELSSDRWDCSATAFSNPCWLLCSVGCLQIIASDARAAVMADPQGEHFPWPGAAGPSLLSA